MITNSAFKENMNIINKNSLPISESILGNNSAYHTLDETQSLEDAIEALSDINKRLELYLEHNYKS